MLSQLQVLFLFLFALESGSQGREDVVERRAWFDSTQVLLCLTWILWTRLHLWEPGEFHLERMFWTSQVNSLARNVCCSLELGVVNPEVIPATLATMAVVRIENCQVWSLPARLKGLWMVSFNPDSATRPGPSLLAGFLPQFCRHAKEPVAGPGGTREGNGQKFQLSAHSVVQGGEKEVCQKKFQTEQIPLYTECTCL